MSRHDGWAKELQDFALSHAMSRADQLERKAFRHLPRGWAVALSVNR